MPEQTSRRTRLNPPSRLSPLVFAAALVSVLVLVAAGARLLAPTGPDPLDRSAVIARAMSWAEAEVAYDQLGHTDGYRTDCSGFVSMAWDLPENLTTWRIPLVAEKISKNELQAGDVLLDHTSDNRHVVIFEKWANWQRTRYWAIELSGNDEIMKTVRRVVPYPYLVNQEHYEPYRFVGMDGYWTEVPKSARQPVE